MKHIQASKPPAETPWERLDRAFRSVLAVPQEKLLREYRSVKRSEPRSTPDFPPDSNASYFFCGVVNYIIAPSRQDPKETT